MRPRSISHAIGTTVESQGRVNYWSAVIPNEIIGPPCQLLVRHVISIGFDGLYRIFVDALLSAPAHAGAYATIIRVNTCESR